MAAPSRGTGVVSRWLVARGETGVGVDRQEVIYRVAAAALNVGGMVHAGGVTANKIARSIELGRPRVVRLATNLGLAADCEDGDLTDIDGAAVALTGTWPRTPVVDKAALVRRHDCSLPGPATNCVWLWPEPPVGSDCRSAPVSRSPLSGWIPGAGSSGIAMFRTTFEPEDMRHPHAIPMKYSNLHIFLWNRLGARRRQTLSLLRDSPAPWRGGYAVSPEGLADRRTAGVR